jgi:phosphinothricin acetyltransferase
MPSTASETVAIRPATLADVGAITAIYAHYVLTHTATFEIEPPDEAEIAARMRNVLDRKLPYWVGERSGAVIGYCYMDLYRSRPAYRHTVEDSIYVAPDQVGRGAGRQLLAQAIASCAAQGYREIVAVIGDTANEPSIRLHRSAGFAHVGTLTNVGYKFDRWLDTVVMQRSLRAA